MATRYMIAMDHVDLHAREVMRKYAKRRPLGDIESRHRYTVPQPVLSCRTVDIDTTGTRTYRPRSSLDIIQEQHRLIHDIYTKSRNVSSAPTVRRVQSGNGHRYSDDSYQRLQKINVEVHGRPATSFSETNVRHIRGGKRPQTSGNRKRPKTTGQLKKSKSTGDFMVLKIDPDIILSSRVQKQLTNKIHQQWSPENHDLSSGRFVRGQSQSGNQSPSGVDSPVPGNHWLTFAGSHDDSARGIVDAFVCKDSEEHYSIDGMSGIRVAQQLSKGDKIRIGINGTLRSEDLAVRETTSTRMNKDKDKIVPLCWSEQVCWPETKVLKAREPPEQKPRPNLCETHQVVFKKLIPDEPRRPKLAGGKTQADFNYKVKTRPRKSTSQSYRPTTRSTITDITIDQSSEEDGELDNISVDKIFEKRFQNKTSPKPVTEVTIQGSGVNGSSKTQAHESRDMSPDESQAALTEKTTMPKSVVFASGSGKPEGPPTKAVFVKPTPPSFQMNTNPDPELSITVPGGKPLESQATSPRPNSSKNSFNRSNQRAQSAFGLSFESSPKAEFIHFSTGLVNPNPHRRGRRSPRSVNRAIPQVRQDSHTITTDQVTSPRTKSAPDRIEDGEFPCNGMEEGPSEGGAMYRRTNTPVSPVPLASTFAISIPTADLDKMERTSSVFSSRNLTPDSAFESPDDAREFADDAEEIAGDPGMVTEEASELVDGSRKPDDNTQGSGDHVDKLADASDLAGYTIEPTEATGELADASDLARYTVEPTKATRELADNDDDDDNGNVSGEPDLKSPKRKQDILRDSQIEQIASLLGESLMIPNQSEFSSSQSETSSSRRSETSDTAPVTNKSQLRVTFKTEPELSRSTEDFLESLPQASVRDLLSSPAHPDSTDASVEVRRLRQQIKKDLHKAQEDTVSDIEYLRMKRGKPFT